MHVLHAAKAPLERGREDDDRHLGTSLAQLGSHVGAETSGAEVVVQDRDVDAVQQLLCFFDRVGGLRDVAVLAQDGRAQQQVFRMIVQQ
jgi:hypothetical protein